VSRYLLGLWLLMSGPIAGVLLAQATGPLTWQRAALLAAVCQLALVAVCLVTQSIPIRSYGRARVGHRRVFWSCNATLAITANAARFTTAFSARPPPTCRSSPTCSVSSKGEDTSKRQSSSRRAPAPIRSSALASASPARRRTRRESGLVPSGIPELARQVVTPTERFGEPTIVATETPYTFGATMP
jgi:hypothetical protein